MLYHKVIIVIILSTTFLFSTFKFNTYDSLNKLELFTNKVSGCHTLTTCFITDIITTTYIAMYVTLVRVSLASYYCSDLN